jgi:succinate dehydrogenase / fumarate reductase iron-sulfur subunit
MNLKLKVWRQKDRASAGDLVDIEAHDIPGEASFLEMLDIVNDELTKKGQEPIAFDHDCREGICGTCSLTINGIPHGDPKISQTTTCQLYMRKFKDGDTIYIEPFRARAFPVIKDLCVDRTAFERIQQAGGYITARAGSAQDANAILISKERADAAMEAAACIACGACVAACPNGAAMLFVGAKVSHLSYLPQGEPERQKRALAMVAQMDEEGFGNCSNYYECEAVCPANIPASVMSRLNREYAGASVRDTVGTQG